MVRDVLCQSKSDRLLGGESVTGFLPKAATPARSGARQSAADGRLVTGLPPTKTQRARADGFVASGRLSRTLSIFTVCYAPPRSLHSFSCSEQQCRKYGQFDPRGRHTRPDEDGRQPGSASLD